MKLFFNYRREDTADLAGRLHDRLSGEFGTENIFKDVDSIRPGQDWRVALEKSVVSSDVVLAIIGRQWLTICDATGKKRIESDEDYVRFELEAARRAGKVVVPLLVQDAKVPQPTNLPESIRWLSNTHAAELRPDPYFKDDVNRLVAELSRIREQLKITAQQNASMGFDSSAAVRCGKCNAQCSRTDLFCQACGAGLWTACPSCKSSVPTSQVHCGTCGAHLTKLREVSELIEKIEKRYAVIAGMLDVHDRLSAIENFSRELDAAIRVYPQQQRLMELEVKTRELWRSSARLLADSVFQSGMFERARGLYVELKKLDPLSEHAAARITEIETRLRHSLNKCREQAGKGDYKGAVEALTSLAEVFPGDTDVRSELSRCQAISTRLSQLIPDGLRELKRQRCFFKLEQELLWLKEQKIPIRNLDSWLVEVKDSIRKANSDFQQAQSELRSGKIRNSQKLADAILKQVSDHQGARELLENTGDAEAKILQVQLLVKRQHFCAANRLIRKLEEEQVSDARLTRLAAATKVEIASMDSSIRMMLILGFIASLPGYFLKGLLISKLPLFSESLTEPGILVSAAIILTLPSLLITVIFLATPLRIERVVRFLMDWLQLWRLTDQVSRIGTPIQQTSAENEKGPSPESILYSEPAPQLARGDITPPQRRSRAFESVVQETSYAGQTENSASDSIRNNPVLYRSKDIDRSAQLFEIMVFLCPLFSAGLVAGTNTWSWLLELKFDPELEADRRSIEILSPFSMLLPIFLLWLGGVLLSPTRKWKNVLLTGVVGGMIAFLAAILYPAATWWIRALTVVSLSLMSVHLAFQDTIKAVVTRFFAGVIGGLLVLSAITVPLAVGASVINYSDHTLPENLMLELGFTTVCICQIFVLSANPQHLLLPALAKDSPTIRGTLATGAAWISAAVLTLVAGWLTSILREEWQSSGRWVVLLLLLQVLPETMMGRHGMKLHRPWLIASTIATVLIVLTWWISPSTAYLFAPVLISLTIANLLVPDSVDLFEAGIALKEQLQIRHARRVFELKSIVRRRVS